MVSDLVLRVSRYDADSVIGIELVLYFQLIRLLLGLQKRTRMDVFLIVFSTVLLVLNTIFWVSQVWLGDLAWIVHPGYPGGAEAYLYANTSVWYQLWGTAASVACNLMNDALLVSLSCPVVLRTPRPFANVVGRSYRYIDAS